MIRKNYLSELSSMQKLAFHLSTIGTSILRLLPAETAHNLGVEILRKGLIPRSFMPPISDLCEGLDINVPGLGSLQHPIGLAAGFDKHALAPAGFSALGLSYIEIGTITPKPQEGNAKPRMFRLPDQKAIINRMGFNSHGKDKVFERLNLLNWDHQTTPLGVNVGKNKLTPEEFALDDFSEGLNTFEHLGKYFVINISSPNTEGLRDLASESFIENLANRHKSIIHKVWVKLDPDMTKEKFQAMISAISRCGFQGVILSNTHKVAWPEAGGLSGHPLASRASTMLEWAYEVHGGNLPMISSGGILSGLDVLERIERGAHCVQIYSSLVYRGPWAVYLMLKELQYELKAKGFKNLEEARGSFYR